MTTPILAYMMAPISPSNGFSVAENLAAAKAWLHFLRTLTRDERFGGRPIVIAAPYIASIEAGADESSDADREHGLRDDCAIVARFDMVIAIGYSRDDKLTGGMRLEHASCSGPLVDLMDFGRAWARPSAMPTIDRFELLCRLHAGADRLGLPFGVPESAMISASDPGPASSTDVAPPPTEIRDNIRFATSPIKIEWDRHAGCYSATSGSYVSAGDTPEIALAALLSAIGMRRAHGASKTTAPPELQPQPAPANPPCPSE